MCYFKVRFSNCRFIFEKCTSVLFQKGVCVVPFYRPLLHATWTWVSWRFKLTPLVKRSTPFTRSVISTELSTFGLFLNLNKLDANVLKLLYLHHISISYQFAAVCTVISTFLWYIDLMDSWKCCNGRGFLSWSQSCLLSLVSSASVIGTKIAHNDSWRHTEILYHSLNGKGQP